MNLQASLMVQYELSKICKIILLPVPKVNKLSVPIFLKKKRDFTTSGGENFFFN